MARRVKPYVAPTGSVWEMDSFPEGLGTIFVVLDGHVKRGDSLYRCAFSLSCGTLSPFGDGSWMDDDSKRIA